MNKTITAAVIIAVIAVGGYFLFSGQTNQQETQSPATKQPTTAQPEQTPDQQPAQMPAERIVRYTRDGYVPSILTITKGGVVVFINENSQPMWTASAVHPTHNVYSGTNLGEHCPDLSGTAFDQCGPGNEFRFTFTKSGTWKYHNHLNMSHTGTIIIEYAEN